MSRRFRVIRTHRMPARVRTLLVPVLASLCLAAGGAHAEEADATHEKEKEEKTVVEAGATVGLEYTLTLEDGTEVENNVGGEVLRFEQGAGQIIPGLDKEVVGMKVGESKHVTVAPEEGYGPVDPAAFTEVPVSQLPEDARTPGAALMSRDPQGRVHRLRVHEIKGENAVLDFNHPFAGKTLIFDIKVVEIR